MSPMQIWCNEVQKRYVLAIAPADLSEFSEICKRERCPFAVIGQATGDGKLVVHDAHFGSDPVSMELAVLLGKPPRMRRDVRRLKRELPPIELAGLSIEEASHRVLRLPSVADK